MPSNTRSASAKNKGPANKNASASPAPSEGDLSDCEHCDCDGSGSCYHSHTHIGLRDGLMVPVPAIHWDELRVVLGADTGLSDKSKTLIGLLISHTESLSRTVEHLSTQLAKNEQYSRRNTVVVANVSVTEGENNETLKENVCKLLSEKSGSTVKPTNIQAIHRNAKPKSDGGSNNGSGNSSTNSANSPPTVTVRFYDFNLKDKVLRNGKNPPVNTRKPRVVQSLTPHFKKLKGAISKFCKDRSEPIKFIHYTSSTKGLCVKFSGSGKGNSKDENDGKMISGIFCLRDFLIKHLGKNYDRSHIDQLVSNLSTT